MKRWVMLLCLFSMGTFCVYAKVVNVVGYIKSANGLGRVTTSIIDVLSRKSEVTFIDTRPQFTSFEDVPRTVAKLAQKKNKSGSVSILTDNPWLPPNIEPSVHVPDLGIKLAYSMCESTKIPAPWVSILNRRFDAVVVPDSWLIEVYRSSGVKIPLFVVPIALYLDDFLNAPLRTKPHTPFTFGISAALSKHKNVELLVSAFAREFGNRSDVILKIHSPWEGNSDEIKKQMSALGVKNIELSAKSLSAKDYLSFMQSLDCYCLLSRGEGFSITVREAMALGLPCLISNNTAHKTICDTGLVYGVRSTIIKQADREFFHVDVGNNFDCEESDVRKGLRAIKNNYSGYQKKGALRREWVRRYTLESLEELYAALVNPPDVIMGDRNEITTSYLMTNSQKLYKKYKKLAPTSKTDL